MRSCLILLALLPTLCLAHHLKETQLLPTVSIVNQGELRLTGKDFAYQNWSSSQLTGKVRLLQHIAGRSSAKTMNAPLIEAIKAAKFPHDEYQTTTIINLDDALFATGSFVVSSVEKSKREFPWSSFVIDADGRVRQSWGLEPDSSAIILLDPQGRILFVKDGALTAAEITEVLALIRSHL
jgi:uncharacterized protein